MASTGIGAQGCSTAQAARATLCWPVLCALPQHAVIATPQGIKHTRRAMRAQGLDPGSVSQPGTPASCASPLAGSRSASPSRAPRGRHSRHGSADWGGGAGGAPAVEPAPESLICSVCGIMATSAVNLEVRAGPLPLSRTPALAAPGAWGTRQRGTPPANAATAARAARGAAGGACSAEAPLCRCLLVSESHVCRPSLFRPD